jgi:hypothetical protein
MEKGGSEGSHALLGRPVHGDDDDDDDDDDELQSMKTVNALTRPH